ncbi:MAG: hypothetical protein F6K16_05265 [Symploca sp. SIO2B6]|nr:hypothetical protein [Symploca sp. SIO2B6]
MKVKAVYIPTFLLVANFIVSLPQVAATFSSIRLGGFSLIGVVRVGLLPVLLFILIDTVKSRRIKKIGSRFWIEMILPIFAFLILLIFQIFTLPSRALSGHLSGSADYVFLWLSYLCIVLNLNNETAYKTLQIISLVFLLIFIAAIIQYPYLIISSGKNLLGVLSSYGQSGKIKTFALFASANEDANAIMTLFPFALFYIEKTSGIKRVILRAIILIYIPAILLFNGTRTALIISFPFILSLFYSNLSFKKTIRLFPFLVPIIGLIYIFTYSFVGSAFSREAADEGSLNWRMENLWIPATTYTREHSPLVGFGSLGWDYVSRAIEIGYGSGSFLKIIPSHNLYVWSYVGWGTIGLSILLVFIAILFKGSFKLSKLKNFKLSSLSKTVFCSIFGYCIWGCISNAFMPAGWSIFYSLGIIIASMRIILVESNKQFFEYKTNLEYQILPPYIKD